MDTASPEYIHSDGIVAKVIRTPRRKTATIKVVESAVSVVVPQNLSEQRISGLLSDKNQWIKDKIATQKAVEALRLKQFISGEAFSYLGKNYRLKVNCGQFQPVKMLNGYLVVTVPNGSDNPHFVRNALVEWYQSHAAPKLIEKTQRYANYMGVQPAGVCVKAYKSRWGNCDSKGQISYNWKIVIAPHWVVDYVVVHELCHLQHFNHSKDFWRKVEHYCPDARKAQEWLREHGSCIDF